MIKPDITSRDYEEQHKQACEEMTDHLWDLARDIDLTIESLVALGYSHKYESTCYLTKAFSALIAARQFFEGEIANEEMTDNLHESTR